MASWSRTVGLYLRSLTGYSLYCVSINGLNACDKAKKDSKIPAAIQRAISLAEAQVYEVPPNVTAIMKQDMPPMKSTFPIQSMCRVSRCQIGMSFKRSILGRRKTYTGANKAPTTRLI